LHASVAHNRKLIVDWVPAGDLEDVTYGEVNNNVSVVIEKC
jgi:CTP synthase